VTEPALAALNQFGNSLTIPSIKTRRAETTLEIPSGGSMAMAGLIQDQTKAGYQRFARPGPIARSWTALQEPGFHSSGG
jgi:Flp pilus assembly secretin CpaC